MCIINKLKKCVICLGATAHLPHGSYAHVILQILLPPTMHKHTCTHLQTSCQCIAQCQLCSVLTATKVLGVNLASSNLW